MFGLLAANLKVGIPSLAPLSVSYPRHPWCQQRRRSLLPCSQERGRAVLNPSLLPCRLQPLPLPLLSRRREGEGSAQPRVHMCYRFKKVRARHRGHSVRLGLGGGS